MQRLLACRKNLVGAMDLYSSGSCQVSQAQAYLEATTSAWKKHVSDRVSFTLSFSLSVYRPLSISVCLPLSLSLSFSLSHILRRLNTGEKKIVTER